MVDIYQGDLVIMNDENGTKQLYDVKVKKKKTVGRPLGSSSNGGYSYGAAQKPPATPSVFTNVAQSQPKSNTQNAKPQIAANNPPANNNTPGSKSLSYEGSVKEKGKGTYEVYNEDILQKYMPPEPKLPFHTEEARLESERARRKVAERRMLAEQKRTSLEAERAKREQSTIQKDEEAKQNVQKQSETKASETPAKAKAYESRKVTEFDNHMRSVLGIDKYHNNRAMRAVEMEFKEKIKNGEISPEDRKKELRSSVLDFFVKTFKKK